VLLALVPAEFAISFAIIVMVVIITSNIRLGVFVGLAFLPLIVWQIDGSGMLIAYSLALPLFLGLRSLPNFREAAASTEKRKSLIFDREYHFWQTRKNK